LAVRLTEPARRAAGSDALWVGCDSSGLRVFFDTGYELSDCRSGSCCDEPACRRTFAEQVPGLTVLAAVLRNIAVALAGRVPGPVIAHTGESATLLRLVMAVPDPAAPTPQVLGVDGPDPVGSTLGRVVEHGATMPWSSVEA